jgi:hypothetical protein
MEKKLTKTQIGALRAAYHGRDWNEFPGGTTPAGDIFWRRAPHAGGARRVMLDKLRYRGYLTGEGMLTVKGYDALEADREAMRFIDAVELANRRKGRAMIERDIERSREAQRREREAARAAAEAQSRKDRLAKLMEEKQVGFDPAIFETDDALLAFAERVREIMEVY